MFLKDDSSRVFCPKYNEKLDNMESLSPKRFRQCDQKRKFYSLGRSISSKIKPTSIK